MQRILIITNGPLCRNPRPLKEAETLGRAGHDVTVLTVRNHEPSEATDVEILRTAPFRRETVDMLPGRGGPAVWGRRLRLRLARTLATRLGWPLMEAMGPAGALLSHARRLPGDLTIVHNEVAHWVGTRLLAEGRRVAADMEDWHSEDLLPEERAGRPLARIRATERALLHRAAYVSTTSHALAAALQARHGGARPLVISNSFPLQSDPRRGPPGDPPAFFWFSQTLGPGRGLGQFLAAWRLTREPSRLVLLGQSRAGFGEELRARLPPERREQMELRPLVPPAELATIIARHDLGLALEQPFIPNRDLTITNKILQYLNAGLAVVASDTAGQREVLAGAPEAGLLVELHETTQLARQLDRLLADRATLAARQRAARKLAEDQYCWEREAPRLLNAVETALRT
jgi:glycosyltransferase involved in cell wall biosynthesis